MGVGEVYSCVADAVCATVVGTEVRFYEGYGNTTINVVKRGCEYRNLFDGDNAQCLSDPRSADILKIGDEGFPRVSFTGEACYCTTENCNGELRDIQRVVRPDHPDQDAPGLQCVSCNSRVDINGTEILGDAALKESCLKGDLTDPGVFYDTCPPEYACMKLQGEFTYFIGAAFSQVSVVERRCIPKEYTSGEAEGCLIMDEITENLQNDYSSYYFYFDAITVNAPACHCSTDICDCDIQECLAQDLTCDSSENLCPNENEVCSDTVNGPECLCVDGYERDSRNMCQRRESCKTTTCTIPNSECVDMKTGPRCVCKRDYLMNAKSMKCVSKQGGSDGVTNDQDNSGVEFSANQITISLISAVTLICMRLGY